MSDKKIDSLKHKKATRARIPSKEEAGSESNEPSKAELPLNPVTTRGRDPELYWLEKYGPEDDQDALDLDIRSLYRTEHIAPEKLIQRLYRLKRENAQQDDLFVDDLFANYKDIDELDKPTYYYKQADQWANRLIQGDSLLVMGSLLEREGMKGQVQMIYIDPPYGIKYNSNWQIRVGDRNVKDGDDASLSGEPEVIKAFRDTWELGIHSYLSYLRDRLLVAKELLSESGSCFVQISDENVHLVRCLMDEVFGSENFISQITFRKKLMPLGSNTLESMADFIIWYGKSKSQIKYNQLYRKTEPDPSGRWTGVQTSDNELRRLTPEERKNFGKIPDDCKIFGTVSQWAPSFSEKNVYTFEFEGKAYTPTKGQCWITSKEKMEKLAADNRLFVEGEFPRYVVLHEDFPFAKLTNPWDDTAPAQNKAYVVQTNSEVIARCILMTTDPGDLVLDPTCGSGTTAYVAEQWGRRWITTDTSRVALNIAKTRLMTATFPWYTLKDEKAGLQREIWDVRHGFDYKTVQRITLGSLANDEPPEEVTLFDQPALDKKKLRIAGPFTVETLQSFEPLSPEAVDEASLDTERLEAFQHRVFEHLKSAGVKNGQKNENAVFVRIDPLTADYLHAEGYYDTAEGEQKAYIHLGPQFAPVSKAAVNEAVKACRQRGDAQWLLILGFAFESDVENSVQNQRAGAFRVDKVRMHDDLLQAGLTKKDKKAATFVTIGEPDIAVLRDGDTARVEIRGLDIYDPIKDEVKARSVADIAYWMVDDDYDGANFMVRQVFFCGGDKDEFAKWQKGISELAKAKTKKKVENTLKIELDDEAFDRLYGFVSHPLAARPGQRVAVRVVSQFGEESTKILSL
ncbi:site-specific DNA-methyltransferase [Azonexus sp.]|jgi:adenine-specific DNA-methyltransferase|uniref:site-specific DNA-methyltransferase n=1 Tax=Azonexus sp. TaxID=1872668 RepID=UPI0035AE9E30